MDLNTRVPELVEEELLGILESAIQDEVESQKKYQMALGEAKLPESKALFEQLIQAEADHERLLRERYAEIKKRMEVKIMSKWSRWVGR